MPGAVKCRIVPVIGTYFCLGAFKIGEGSDENIPLWLANPEGPLGDPGGHSSSSEMSENPIDASRTLSVARHVDAVQFYTVQPLCNHFTRPRPSFLKSTINHLSSVLPTRETKNQ